MTLEGALTLFELYNLQGLAKSIPTMFAVFLTIAWTFKAKCYRYSYSSQAHILVLSPIS